MTDPLNGGGVTMLPFGFLDVVTLFMLLVACPLHAQEKSTEAEPENTQPSLESLQEEYDDKRVQDRATTGAVAVVGTLVGVGIPTYLLVTGNKKRVDDLFHKCMHDEIELLDANWHERHLEMFSVVKNAGSAAGVDWDSIRRIDAPLMDLYTRCWRAAGLLSQVVAKRNTLHQQAMERIDAWRREKYKTEQEQVRDEDGFVGSKPPRATTEGDREGRENAVPLPRQVARPRNGAAEEASNGNGRRRATLVRELPEVGEEGAPRLGSITRGRTQVLERPRPRTQGKEPGTQPTANRGGKRRPKGGKNRPNRNGNGVMRSMTSGIGNFNVGGFLSDTSTKVFDSAARAFGGNTRGVVPTGPRGGLGPVPLRPYR